MLEDCPVGIVMFLYLTTFDASKFLLCVINLSRLYCVSFLKHCCSMLFILKIIFSAAGLEIYSNYTQCHGFSKSQTQSRGPQLREG